MQMTKKKFMLKNISIISILLIVLELWMPSICSLAAIQKFPVPDINLYNALKEQIGDKATYDDNEQTIQISANEMNNITVLNLDNKGITNLEGIQFLSSVTLLAAGCNNITDISPLKTMKRLKELYLNENIIEDVSPLANLTNLEYLWLSNNTIKDVSPLCNLSKLNDLNVGCNPIQNINLLGRLNNLNTLLIYSTSTESIDFVKSLENLTYLDADYNHIEDISAINNLSSLKTYYFLHNIIEKEIYVKGDANQTIDIPEIISRENISNLEIEIYIMH